MNFLYPRHDYPKPDNRPDILRGLPVHRDRDVGVYYLREDLERERVTTIELSRGWLFVMAPKEGQVVTSFAVMTWVAGDSPETYLECLWVGEGISDGLRELRHSWFGEDQEGYIYYIDLDVLAAACEALKKYFDAP